MSERFPGVTTTKTEKNPFDFSDIPDTGTLPPDAILDSSGSMYVTDPENDPFDFGGPTSGPSRQEQQLSALRASTDQYAGFTPLSGTTEAMDELASGRYGAQLAPFANLAKGAEQVLQNAQNNTEQQQAGLQEMVAQEERERNKKISVRFGRFIVRKVLGPMKRRLQEPAYKAEVATAYNVSVADRYSEDKTANPFYVPVQAAPSALEQATAIQDTAMRQRFLEEQGIIQPNKQR